MFLVNSRPGHFSAAPIGFERMSRHPSRHPFSRSYGVNLPSSLTGFHSSALGYSPRLPVSVYGTVTKKIRYEAFLGSMIKASLWAKGPPHRLSELAALRICLQSPPTGLDQHFQSLDGRHSCVPPSRLCHLPGGTGMLTCYPSPTLFSLGLGTD